MDITGTDFIMLPTQNFEEAEKFYGDVLGLERSKTWGDMPAREFETGNLTIAVVETEKLGMGFSPNTNPVALHVADVAESRAELEAQGVEFAMDTMDSGVCFMAPFSDPDGNTLMLHSRYAPPEA
jgi:predicted enzyme related to lactoylglutathione lyase